MIQKEIKDAINNALKLRIPFYAYKQKQNPDFTFGAQLIVASNQIPDSV